jgi:hypothetical protein
VAVYLHSTLTSAPNGDSNQQHAAAALTPGNGPAVPTGQKTESAPGAVAKRKNSASTGNQTLFVSVVA